MYLFIYFFLSAVSGSLVVVVMSNIVGCIPISISILENYYHTVKLIIFAFMLAQDSDQYQRIIEDAIYFSKKK